jgi:hypothetical protein
VQIQQPPPEDDPKLRRLAEQRKAVQSGAPAATPDFEPSTWGKPAYLASPLNPEPVATTSGRKIPPSSAGENGIPSNKGKSAASSASTGWGGGSWGSGWGGGGGESSSGQKSGWGGGANEWSGWGAASPVQNEQSAWGEPSPPHATQSTWGASSPPRAAGTTTQPTASSSSLPASSAITSTNFQAVTPSGTSNTQARVPSWGSVPVTPVEGTFRVPSRKPSLAPAVTEKTMDPRRKAAPPTTPVESTTFQPPLPTRKGKEVDRSIHPLPSAPLNIQGNEGRSSTQPTAAPATSAAQTNAKESSKAKAGSRLTRGSLKTSEERKHVYRSIVKYVQFLRRFSEDPNPAQGAHHGHNTHN